jgi:hypothetical protein
MGEIEKINEIPSTSKLSKLGITAIGYTAAGVFLFLLQFVTKIPGIGLIAGGIVCFFGIASLSSKDNADKRAGSIITAAGVLTLLSRLRIPLIGGISGTLLAIGSIGLFALGIWNGIKFLVGLKKRS